MPTLDVDDAFDISFWDYFTVVRRYTQINQVGRAVVTEVPISARGVVIASSPDDLMRVPEHEMSNKSIAITSPFRFQGPAVDEVGNVTHPDHILWNGSMYVVRALEDYSGYGRGFVHVVCTSIQNADLPPIPEPMGSA